MTIQQIIDEQMREFDFSFFPDLVEMQINYRDSSKNITVATIEDFKSFISSYTRKLIEAVGEEVIGKNEPVRLQEVEVGPEGCTVYDVTEDISIFRNYLRDDQRLKLKEIINSLK